MHRLHALHGKDWVKIGAFLGRSATSVRDTYRYRPKDGKKTVGEWSKAEDDELTKAVYAVTGQLDGAFQHSNIPTFQAS